MNNKIDYSKLPPWTKRPRLNSSGSLDKPSSAPPPTEDLEEVESPQINAAAEKPSLFKLPAAVQKISGDVKKMSGLMQEEHKVINENIGILLKEIRNTTGYKAKILELEAKISELEVIAESKDGLIADLKTEVALRNETMSKIRDALTAFDVEAAYLDLIRTMRDGVQVDINSKKKALEGVLAEVALILNQPL